MTIGRPMATASTKAIAPMTSARNTITSGGVGWGGLATVGLRREAAQVPFRWYPFAGGLRNQELMLRARRSASSVMSAIEGGPLRAAPSASSGRRARGSGGWGAVQLSPGLSLERQRRHHGLQRQTARALDQHYVTGADFCFQLGNEGVLVGEVLHLTQAGGVGGLGGPR